MVATSRCGLYVLSELDGMPVVKLARSFPWSAVEGEDTDCNVPVRSGRFWVQPVGTTGSLVVLDVSTPEKPVIADELAFGVDARNDPVHRNCGALDASSTKAANPLLA